MTKERRILLVQYAGDYREAYYRLRDGGKENYRSQRYTVEAVSQIRQRFGEAAVLIYQTAEKFEAQLPNGVVVFGMGFQGHPKDMTSVIDKIKAWKPTHLVLFCPSREVLDWASENDVRVLAMFGQTEPAGGVRRWWRNRRLAKSLNRPAVEWVGNHHLSATRWLGEIGVNQEKLIPFDYQYPVSPDAFAPKALRPKAPWTVGYVGMVIDGKGIPELIQAVARLNEWGLQTQLRIAGSGDVEKYKAQAEAHGIAEKLEFLGSISNDQVHDFMRAADVVVVPTRHRYTEGFGFVVQEAFVSRSPVVVSDHRAFQGRVIEGETGLVFPGGNSEALAAQLKRLLTDPELYFRLSCNGALAWDRMQIPVKWADLIFRWLEDADVSRQWLGEHRLASGRYDAPAAG